MAKTRKPAIGTVSSATLRTSDLLEAFADELRYLGSNLRLARQCERMAEWLENEEIAEIDAADMLEEAFDALDSLAPPYCYFGTHEGDGSDFGFWPAIETLQEDTPQFGDTGEAQAARHVGTFHVVTDHGNVSCYTRHANGRITEHWACV